MLGFSERTKLMSEPNKNNRTIKEIISDATDRELENFETGTMTPERLTELVAADKRKKKRRFHRLAGLAALFIIAVVGAVMVFNNFTTDVDADKNGKEEVITEDGVVIEDGGWGSSDEDKVILTEWIEVKNLKAIVPDVVIPEYIPKGYNFKKCIVEEMVNSTKVEYLFINDKKNELVLHQYIQREQLESTYIDKSGKNIDSMKGTIYITDNEDNNKATIQLDDGNIVDVWGNLSNDEIVKIIDSLN